MEQLELFLESKTLVNFLINLREKGIKQAYIFSSTDKNKNQASCDIFSLIVSCEGENVPCLNCANCKRILGNNHIDIYHFPKGKSIVVEDIENIIDSCYVLPAENKYKIYILNDFEFANISSQNKFLKTLENPPKDVIFLINTSNLELILDTIKSRCEIINLPRLTSSEIKNILQKENIKVDDFLLEKAAGEIGKYCNLLSNKFKDQYDFCVKMLENMNSSSEILLYSSEILKNKQLENFIVALTLLFEDLLVLKLCPNRSIQSDNKLLEISNKFSKRAIDEILKNLLKSNNELFYNTNENLIVDTILINILEEKYKWN